MKRLVTGALALLLFAGATQAQSKQDTAKFHHREGREMMMKQLNLTSDQQSRLQSIHESERKEMQSLKDQSLSADQLKSQRQALHKKYQEQIQSVFTPAQKDQMKKLRAERKEKGGKQHDGMKKGGKQKFGKRGADFQKELNLSQEQKDQLSKLRADARGQMESIKNDKSLSEDQKKEKIKSLMKDQHEKFQSVLTPEQKEKMESMRKNRQRKNS